MTDLRTKTQRERDERYDLIVDKFSSLRAENPKAAPHRIATVIAEEIGWTAVGVIKALTKRGLYQPKSRTQTTL